jgi:aminoglycoside phosphotransferase (APT) family kinase protein
MTAHTATHAATNVPPAVSSSLSELVEACRGRVVCLSMSKDPNAKLTLLLFAPGESRPRHVAKVATTDAAADRVRAEAAVLEDIARFLPDSVRATVPAVVMRADHNGHPVLVTSALPGRQMLASYHELGHTTRRRTVAADLAAAGRWLADLQDGTAVGWADLGGLLDGTEEELLLRLGDEPGLAADLDQVAALRQRLRGHRTPRTVVHGDFWMGNLLVDRGGVRGVVDWEAASAAGLAVRDLAHFAVTYSLYLDRHTRPGRDVRGHRRLRADRWGAGLDYAIDGTGWYPDLARGFVADGLVRIGLPPSLTRDVLLADIVRVAVEADHLEFARQHLHAFRRLTRSGTP